MFLIDLCQARFNLFSVVSDIDTDLQLRAEVAIGIAQLVDFNFVLVGGFALRLVFGSVCVEHQGRSGSAWTVETYILTL